MNPDVSGTCYRCGRTLSGGDYARSESCAGCDSDTRVCRNCRLFDPRTSSQCREPQADLVADKEKANFCEFFQPGSPQPSGGAPGRPGGGGDKAKDAFAALFKRKPGT